MKKILLICGSSSTVINFRLNLIKALQLDDYEVTVIAFDFDKKSEIENLGVHLYCLADENRGINPFKLSALLKKYTKIIEEVKPNVVMTFMLKPNIFGAIAAHKAGVENIYCMVEGAGDVFINNGVKWRLIRQYVCHKYKKAFRYAKKVIFLNNDDKREFVKKGLVKPNQCELLNGIGVDLEKFAFKPIKNPRTFLMIARMLKTKGTMEYCKVARIVKQKYPSSIFNYLGSEGTIKLRDIQEYIDDGSINYLGTTNDVRPYLEDCAVFVLPSLREGMPMSIMEAEAVGRAIIASNSIGCKDTVQNNLNGFLIERKDCASMSEKVVWCIEHPEEVKRMGYMSRQFAENNFDVNAINRRLLEVIK